MGLKLMIFSTEALSCIPKIIVPGSPLWLSKHDKAQLDTIASGDPYTFSSQYQQNPSPTLT